MDRDEVLAVYDDDEFAAGYNERFLLIPWARHGVDFEITLLRELLAGDDPRWLDVGCGTGWVLGQFPDVPRAGLDLTPAMLRQAEAANPDALFFRQGDFTHDVEEFHGAWSVVSCMWMAYCYLETMPECEALVENLARWTRPGGSVFIPSVIDLEDLRPHVQVPYEEFPDVWGGRIALTGYNWTWEEPNGNVNENMMAVHVGHFVRLLEPHFERIEVVRYPLFQPGFVSRKAVVATGRRPQGETGQATVIWHPMPDDYVAPPGVGGGGVPGATAEDVAELRAQLQQVADQVVRRAADGSPYDIIGVVHDQVGSLRAEVGELRGQLDELRALLQQVVEQVVRTTGDGSPYDIVGVIHDQVGGIREELDQLAQRVASASVDAPASAEPPASRPGPFQRVAGRLSGDR